jgi:hypothetical protein
MYHNCIGSRKSKAMKKHLCLFLSVVITGIFVTGCCIMPSAPWVKEPFQNYVYSDTTMPCEIIPVYGFDQVVISGPVSVTVNGRQAENQVIVHGTAQALKDFSAQTRQGVLTISASEPAAVSLNVNTPIRRLVYDSNGHLVLKNIGDQSMKLVLRGNSVTSMNGELVLSHIELSDNAKLHAYWIDSSNLHVVANNNAKLFLAGVVTNLDIIASGNAEIDGKALRAENAYVRTSGAANVGVTVKHSLGSLSTDRSTVYYYRDSHVDTLYLDHRGSALRMVGIPTPE